MPQIRVILADDHPLLLEGLQHAIQKMGFDVPAVAHNGRILIDLVKKYQPDVVFTDVAMPVMDGVEATRIITDKHPEVAVVGFSMFESVYVGRDLLEVGAMGFMDKSSHPNDIAEAIHTVIEGKPYFGKSYQDALSLFYGSPGFRRRKHTDEPQRTVPVLSPQEKNVLKLIFRGKKTKEIAEILEISGRTVEDHRTKMLRKMNVNTPMKMAIFALKHQLISVHELSYEDD